jgi:predicted nucleic acid-binding protein
VRRLLFDADAFLAIRKLSFLGRLRAAELVAGSLIMASREARNEVSSISVVIESLESSGLLRVEAVRRGTPADIRRKNLLGEALHKGEAESLAIALEGPPETRPIFVTLDTRAAEGARRHGVPCLDVMGLVVELVDRTLLTQAEARALCDPWNDRTQQIGRPADFTTFDDTFARRKKARP